MKKKGSIISWLVLTVTVLFLAFQVVHFIEHGAQVTAWTGGYQDSLYMTPLGMWGMEKLGVLFYPNEDSVRQMKLGFELLHLFGNLIFLLGIIGLLYFIKSNYVKWAFVVQGFHFYEHLSLTMSMIFINKPIGLSTLFGMEMSQWVSVAYRVWWHFIFNLIPSILVALAIYIAYKKYKRKHD